MRSIKVTYLCCKFGTKCAFYQRDEIITKWCSVQNMETFNANIAPILWEENNHTISFAVRIYVCIVMFIQRYCRCTVAQRKFRTNSDKQPSSDNSIPRRYAQFQATGCVCIPERKVRIKTAIETITPDKIRIVWSELSYRVDICRITKCAYIEHL